MASVYDLAARRVVAKFKSKFRSSIQASASLCEWHLERASLCDSLGHQGSAADHREHAAYHSVWAMREARALHQLKAQLVGQGIAGTRPGNAIPKAPATQERVCHVVAADMDAGDTSARATAYGREGIA